MNPETETLIKFISVCHGKTEENFSKKILKDYLSFLKNQYKKDSSNFQNYILYDDVNNKNKSTSIQINNLEKEICKRFSTSFLKSLFPGETINFKNKSINKDFQKTNFILLFFIDIEEEEQDKIKQEYFLNYSLNFIKEIINLDQEIKDKIIDVKVIYCKKGIEESFNLKKNNSNEKKPNQILQIKKDLDDSIKNETFESFKKSYITFFKKFKIKNNWYELFDFIDDYFKKY